MKKLLFLLMLLLGSFNQIFSFKVLIFDIADKRAELEVDENDTILSVKQKLMGNLIEKDSTYKYFIPETQIFYLGEKKLENDKTLKDYGIDTYKNKITWVIRFNPEIEREPKEKEKLYR